MEQYLIDTNVISDYFSSSLPTSAMQLLDNAIDAVPNLSIITQIELLCWSTDPIVEQHIKNFIDDSSILDITADVIANCVEIRRSKKIKTPDAIIAATALTYNLTIITANEKDFTGIKGLKLINPHKFK
jgi:predicted nucleic acid-binding protein